MSFPIDLSASLQEEYDDLSSIKSSIVVRGQRDLNIISEIVQRLSSTNWVEEIAKLERSTTAIVEELQSRPLPCAMCEKEFPLRDLMCPQEIYARNYMFYCVDCIAKIRSSYARICPLCSYPYTAHNINEADKLCKTCYSTEKDRELQRLRTQISRARVHGNEATLSLPQWLNTIRYFEGLCAYCQHKDLEVMEHVITIENGGGTTAQNCVPACTSCNSTKSNKQFSESLFGRSTFERVQTFLNHVTH